MITEQQIKDAGYKQYESMWRSECYYLYQKRVYDENDTAYFIDIMVYSTGYEISADFQTPGDRTFRVHLFDHDWNTVVDIEDFFQTVYKNMKCIPRD